MINLFEEYLPFFKNLSEEHQTKLVSGAYTAYCAKGESFRARKDECLGFVIVKSGRIRVYITSDEGREITLYRLLQRDMCLFTASCAMSNIQFDVMLEAEEDTEVVIVSPMVYKELMDCSLPVARYTNELLSQRLSEVIWLMDRVLNERLDSRLASLLLEESSFSDSDTLLLTQEQLANHLGTAREVVTRILKKFQSGGLVNLKRGSIELLNRAGLNEIVF